MATETTAAEGAAHAASACVNEHGGAIGMPQLCAEWIPNQVFWLVVTLVVIFFVLSRIALPRIGAVLAERKGTITNDLAAAEELKQKARDAERAYQRGAGDGPHRGGEDHRGGQGRHPEGPGCRDRQGRCRNCRQGGRVGKADLGDPRRGAGGGGPPWPRIPPANWWPHWAARRCQVRHRGGRRAAEGVRR
jgi:hypothetical protein